MRLRLRTYMILLVCVVLAPVVLVAAIFAERLWDLRRDAFDQRYLERVISLRLALDSEVESLFGNLDTLAAATARGDEEGLAKFTAQLPYVLAHNPGWALVRLIALDGVPLAEHVRSTTPTTAQLDAVTAARVRDTGKSAASGLVALPDGRHLMTYFAVPVRHRGMISALLYVGVEHRYWLAFLERHPVSKGATLTLTDGAGTVLARTLHNPQWAGKQASPAFLTNIEGRTDGTFRLVGLEGEPFYAAFSRSRIVDWVLSTGVPTAEVETPLRQLLWALGGGFAIALVAAFVAGAFLARYLSKSLSELMNAAAGVGAGSAMPEGRPLPIDEAERVRAALVTAGRQLAQRETALHEALKREAQMGSEVAHASRVRDAFLARLAHELRNPVGAMTTALEVWKRAPSGEATARLVALAQRQLGRLLAIADELADAAEVSAGTVRLDRRPLDLQHAVQDVLGDFERDGRLEPFTLNRRLQHVIVEADERRLGKALAALLDHACASTPPGGQIEVVVDSVGREARLQIRDGSEFVDPQVVDRLFEPVDGAAGSLPGGKRAGLGLGLNVAQRLASLHGGSLVARALPGGRGVSFELRLPRAVGGPRDAETPIETGAVGRQRVLLVEDVADNRDSVVALLRQRGHTVTVAGDGPSGLAAAASGDVDVALVDLGLPGFDGLELAQRVRADPQCASVRLIALTGYARDKDRAAAYAAGFDAFLVKPFDLDRFEHALRERD